MSESTQKCPSCTETVPLEYSVCPFCGFGLLEYELRKFSFKPSLREVFVRMFSFFRHPFKTSEEIAVATEKKGANIILLLFSLFLSFRFFVVMLKSQIDNTALFIIGNPDPEKWSMEIHFNLILFFIVLLVMPFVLWVMFKIFIFISTWLMAKFAAMLGSDASTKQFRSIIGYSLSAVALGEFLGILLTAMGPAGGLSGGTVTYSQFADYIFTLYNSAAMWIFKGLMIVIWIIMIIYSTISLRIIGKMAWVNSFIAMAVPLGLFVYVFYFASIFVV